MTRFLAGIALAGACLVLAAPASAKQSFYFDCSPDPGARVGTESTSWSPTAPTASYQSGAGCLNLDPGLLINDPLVDLFFAGTYAGEVKGIDLTLYSQTQGSPYNGTLGAKEITVTLLIDGNEYLTEERMEASTEPGKTQQGFKHTYSIRGLNLPESTRARDFQLQIGTYYSDDFTPWVWGNAEFPSGITFLDHIDLPPVTDSP